MSVARPENSENPVNSANPVRPSDAASLLVLRGRGAEAEVLMGRRARKHRFMPDVYVFPGGRLDPEDRRAPVLKELPPAVLARLAARFGAPAARGLAVAAARETFEETGLALGEVRAGRLTPDLSGMDYMARAITPPGLPIRFHARFFIVDADAVSGGPAAPISGSGELLDLAFRPLQASLNMPIADVTEFVLEETLRRLRGTATGATPLFSYRNGAPVIHYQNP